MGLGRSGRRHGGARDRLLVPRLTSDESATKVDTATTVTTGAGPRSTAGNHCDNPRAVLPPAGTRPKVRVWAVNAPGSREAATKMTGLLEAQGYDTRRAVATSTRWRRSSCSVVGLRGRHRPLTSWSGPRPGSKCNRSMGFGDEYIAAQAVGGTDCIVVMGNWTARDRVSHRDPRHGYRSLEDPDEGRIPTPARAKAVINPACPSSRNAPS